MGFDGLPLMEKTAVYEKQRQQTNA